MGGGSPMMGSVGLKKLLGFRGLNPMGIGNVIPGFGNQGLQGMLGLAAVGQAGDDSSKGKHVDEITVDDLMTSLIDALDNDKDVFYYEREVTSDPWFKKQQFGGVKSAFSFIDPWMFISQIYGSPFGLSNAQSTYNRAYGAPRNRFSQGMGGMGQHQAPFWGPPPQPQAWGPRPPPQQPWGPPPPPQQPWGPPPPPQQPWGQPPSQPQQPPPQPPPTSPIPPQQPQPPPQQPGVSYHEHFPVPPGMPPPYPPPPPFDPWPQPPPFGGPNPFGGMNPQYPPLYPWGQPPQPPPFGGPAPNPPAGAPPTSDSGTATAGETTSDGN